MNQRVSEAAKTMLKALEEGRLGAFNGAACVYRQRNLSGTEKVCAVGCLFNEQELDEIEERNILDLSIGVLQSRVPAMVNRLGLRIDDLSAFQRQHDKWALGQSPIRFYSAWLANVAKLGVTRLP